MTEVLDLQDHEVRPRKRHFHGPAHLPAGGGDIYVNLYDLADLPHRRPRESALAAQKAARARP